MEVLIYYTYIVLVINMTKVTMIRLPDHVGEEIQRLADRKGLPFATVVKEIICEHVNMIAPAVNPGKTSADTNTITEGMCYD